MITWLVLRQPAEGVPLELPTQVPAELLAEGTEICDLHSPPEERQLAVGHIWNPVKVLDTHTHR